MWNGFDPTPYDRAEWLAHVKAIRKAQMTWSPIGCTLHNTGSPNLKQWVETGPQHDARLRNLENYYEKQLGWHHGPHCFISRTRINGFSPLTQHGIHSTCFNANRFGLEMVGNFAPGGDLFDSGDGALVRDNAVWALACLHKAFGFDADKLTFHHDCPADHHDCPGHLVSKADIIERVKTVMATL
jgi:hypothetical protein